MRDANGDLSMLPSACCSESQDRAATRPRTVDGAHEIDACWCGALSDRPILRRERKRLCKHRTFHRSVSAETQSHLSRHSSATSSSTSSDVRDSTLTFLVGTSVDMLASDSKTTHNCTHTRTTWGASQRTLGAVLRKTNLACSR